MPDRQDLHATGVQAVDNAVVSVTDFPHLGIRVLGNRSTSMGLIAEAVTAINEPTQPSLRILRLILRNVILDLLEPEQCPFCPDNPHALSIPKLIRTSSVL